MYRPSLGVWLSRDPIELEGVETNAYEFVGDNPVNATDPLGLAQQPTIEFAKEEGNASAVSWNLPPQPKVPQGLNVYSHADMRWLVTDCDCKETGKGKYEFWFEGLAYLPELKFNLSRTHGSHLGTITKKNQPPQEYPQLKTDEELKNGSSEFPVGKKRASVLRQRREFPGKIGVCSG